MGGEGAVRSDKEECEKVRPFQEGTSVVTSLQKEEIGCFPLLQAEIRQVKGPLLAAFWFPSLKDPQGLDCCIYLM